MATGATLAAEHFLTAGRKRVRPPEDHPNEGRLAEVRLKILMHLTPVVPLRDALVSEDSDLFRVGHFQLSTD